MLHGLQTLARAPRSFRRFAAALAASTPATTAQAQVTLETPQAASGAHYKAVLRVTHGCEGSPVTQVIVDIPPGFQGAKPRAKPGWRIEIVRARLAQPYTRHGRTVTEDVAQGRFTGGPLPDDQFDEFALNVKLPEEPGPLYWNVSQVCEKGRIDGAEGPRAGQALHDLKAPAALLEVQPAEHAHHTH